MRVIDLSGLRFERLTVIGREPSNARGKAMWLVRCDCGAERIVEGVNLRNGNTKSCGCFQRDVVRRLRRRTDLDKRVVDYPEYAVWCSMIRRCTNAKDTAFHNYGARGISVCEAWLNNFATFLRDVGERPDDALELERIDVNGHYEPGNVRWATIVEQANNRRNNVKLTYQGRTQTVAEWSRELGLKQYTIYARIRTYGWSAERALSTPCNGKRAPRPSYLRSGSAGPVAA